MPLFDIPLVHQVKANTYEQAVDAAETFAWEHQKDGMSIWVAPYEHDNEGQRVIYLHAENDPTEEDE
jgi:hypothetical protein